MYRSIRMILGAVMMLRTVEGSQSVGVKFVRDVKVGEEAKGLRIADVRATQKVYCEESQCPAPHIPTEGYVPR